MSLEIDKAVNSIKIKEIMLANLNSYLNFFKLDKRHKV